MLQGISLEDQGSAPSEAVRIRDSDWGFARLPSLDEMFEAAQAGQATPLLEGLRLSRTFNSPDCVDSMAEVLRISRAVEGLKVGLTCDLLTFCMHGQSGSLPS